MALLRRLKTPFMEDLPDGEAVSPLGPRSAGDVLRQQRETLGLDLDDVAAGLMAPAPNRRGGEPPLPPTAETLTEAELTTAPGTAPPAPGPIRSEPAPTENWAGALPAPPRASASGLPSAALLLPAAAAALPTEAPHTYGVVDGTARVVIRATADSWIQIRSTDQPPLFTRVLKAGESYLVPNQPGVSMRTGNAGGLEITVDGKPTPSIGPNGAIRTVPLEPRALISRPNAGWRARFVHPFDVSLAGPTSNGEF